MKNIIYIILTITAFNCKAQTSIISMVDNENNDNIELTAGSYFKDVQNKFTPYLGTWKWEDGNNEFIIVFEKIEMVFDGKYYADHLVGKYRYKENGITILNTLNYNIINAGNLYTSEGYPFIIDGSDYTTDTFQRLSYFDEIRNKPCSASIEFIDALVAPDGTMHVGQAIWKLWNKEHTRLNGQPVLPQGFSLPTEVTLTKQ